MIRSRGTRSASAPRNGPVTADGASRSIATKPTAAAPPARNATIDSPTVNAHSAAHAAPNDNSARRRLELRALDANASHAFRARA